MTEQEYIEFIQPYIDAGENIMTRLQALNKDYRRKYQNYPIYNLQQRIKKKQSIHDKLTRLDLETSADNARTYLKDIAGIRVICYFINDIYHTVETIKKQTDLVVIKECDYISVPKHNGYRSYHIVLGTPVYYEEGMEYFPVEIQLRTMSMDFWASMEHRICYKKNPDNKNALAGDLLAYAEQLKEIESNFEKHYDK